MNQLGTVVVVVGVAIVAMLLSSNGRHMRGWIISIGF